jgi:dTDP-4-amino-4,6-dideoxygalactose transaminase
VKIAFNNLKQQYLAIKEKLLLQLEECFEKSNFILGDPVSLFEKNFAEYIGTKHAIAVSNGTDAIKLGLLALELKRKTAIYTQANTYAATVLSSVTAYPKAKIFLIDIDQYQQLDLKLLEKKIKSNKNKFKNHVIIPVHMFGNMCDMQKLLQIAEKYKAIVMEDASQAHGTMGKDGKKAGSYGYISAFSLYPGKNLGAFGDAGIITTNNDQLTERIKMLRHLGQKEKFYHDVLGYNHSMDTVQAIVLNEKLKHLDAWNQSRSEIVDFYRKEINNPNLKLPEPTPFCQKHTWHVFYVMTKNKDKLVRHLKQNEIEYNFHYPVPVEIMKPFLHLKQKNKKARMFSQSHVSLPIHPFMTRDEVEYVCMTLNRFYL